MDTAAVSPIATWGLDLLFIATVSGVLLFFYLLWWLIALESQPEHGSGDDEEGTTPGDTRTVRGN
jgi:hypothetical protein